MKSRSSSPCKSYKQIESIKIDGINDKLPRLYFISNNFWNGTDIKLQIANVAHGFRCIVGYNLREFRESNTPFSERFLNNP